MSTDEMIVTETAPSIEDDGTADRLFTEAALITGTKERKPEPGIVTRLKEKKAKGETKLSYLDFAYKLVNTLGMRTRTAVLSVKEQYGLTTREARLAVKDAKVRKPRRRK